MRNKQRATRIALGGVIIFLLSCSFLRAAFEFKERGGRSTALGGAYTAVSDDAEGVWWNPAGIRLARTIQVDTSYTALYGMSDLALINFAAVVPTLYAGTWGLGYSSFGFSDYRETDLRLSFATGLREGIYFGTNLKSSSVKIGSGGGSGGVFAVDAGFLGNITENYSIGFTAYNINRPRLLSGPGEYLQQRYMFGLYALPVEGVAVSADFHKVPDEDWEHRLGLEFPLTGNFLLRAGVQSRPARFSFGFGAQAGIFSLNYSYRTHSELEAQHMFSMQGRFGRDPDDIRRVSPADEVEEEEETGIVVNINTATSEELTAVPGLGPTTAGRIIEYREQTGEFRSVRDLMRIYGFTRDMYSRFRDYLTVEGETTIAPDMMPVPWRVPDIGDYYEEHYAPDEAPEEVPVEEPEEKPEEVPAEEPEEEPGEDPEADPEEELFNLNTASAAELRGAGIPPALARSIIRYRSSHGDFNQWEDLMSVPGMRRSFLESLQDAAVLEPSR